MGTLALGEDCVVIAASQVISPVRFQGQWVDAETGLCYNCFRHYDAQAAQYIAADILGLTGGYRPFGYVWSPNSEIDTHGLEGGNPLLPTPTGKGTAGQITGPNMPGGSETGLSTRAGGGGTSNPAVQEMYDNVPPEKRSFYHGKCCEADALSKAANKSGVQSTQDLKSMSNGANSRDFSSSGRYIPPCQSCAHVLNSLGISSGK